MTKLRLVCIAAVLCLPALPQTTDVGTGAPTEAIRQSFVAAYFRNGFYLHLSLPPLSEVKKLGTTGYVQEFADTNKTAGVRFALVKPNLTTQPADGSDVFQMQSGLYAYYTQVGVSTAGYPASDTIPCPTTAEAPCTYQLFDKPYVLTVYQKAIANGQNFSLRDPFYTRWSAVGGITVLGPPASAETAVTVTSGMAATMQAFSQGALFNITSGLLNGRFVLVKQPVYSFYVSNGGHAGFLGLPTGDEIVLPNGRMRQSFEGGAIEYDSVTGLTLRLPVAGVSLAAGGATINLKLGETFAATAVTHLANGANVIDRVVSFTTSNSRVISIKQSGYSAVLEAVGGGTANVAAVSEGKTSQPIRFIVTAPCCQVGEGAPTAAMQQSFQDAVLRNRLTLKLPSASSVKRIGAGYVQDVVGLDSTRYLLAVPDGSPVGFVVYGPVLERYENLGGPSQNLGYPVSDVVADAAGLPRQMFQNAALAGSPVRVVTGNILNKWSAAGYDAAGQPLAEQDSVLSFAGTAGAVQPFQKGLIAGRDTRTYFVSGLVLTRYAQMGTARGQLGFPISDEVTAGGKRRQDFEGGALEYAPGDSQALFIERARTPAVSVSPATVVPGSRLRITISGFANDATLRVSLTGQADFSVRTSTGAHFWDVYVPPNTANGTVRVRAADTSNPSIAAEGSYTVRNSSDARGSISKVRGDNQTGVPGAVLPVPVRVALRDDAGNPAVGISVRFSATPGAVVASSSVTTDERGEAETLIRLPANEGISLVNAEALRQVTTFSLRASATSLANYPKQLQASDKAAMVAAVSSMIRYYQNRGELAAPNGVAEPLVLEQNLKSLCLFDSQAVRICDGFVSKAGSTAQFVNLWRLDSFTGGNLDVSIEQPDAPVIRDLVAQGDPVLLALAITVGGVSAGTHFVVATGVSADGSILIHDPSPLLARSSLPEYLAGFSAAGRQWKGAIGAAIRLLPRAASPSGFVSLSAGPHRVASPAGPCRSIVEWPDAVAGAEPATNPQGVLRQIYCDGSQPVYQVEFDRNSGNSATITDLAIQGGRFEIGGTTASFKVVRSGPLLSVQAADTTFSSQSVVNAATFTSDMAPGSLVAIFGSGLGGAGSEPRVEISGRSAAVVAASLFQLNVQLPVDLAAGTHILRITSLYGSAEQPIDIQALAPAVFRVEANRGAVLNQDGKLNAPSSPARRGSVVSIYGTGFGTVVPDRSLLITELPVTATLAGRPIPVQYAGIAPGLSGVYQINVAIPADAAPGLDLLLALRIGQVESSPVEIAVQ